MGIVEEMISIFDVEPDARTAGLFLMTSIYWPIGLSLAYLFVILVVAPMYMKNRPAYDLKTYIICYNIYQVFACWYTGWGILTSGWTTKFSLGCEPPDFSNDPEALRLLHYMYLVVLLKVTEFSETLVFVLRKKDRQVSFLHLYHHVVTFWIVWIGARYTGGGMSSFPILPNSFVHVIMYTYYLLSLSKNPTFQRWLGKIKPYITIMQMVQFVIILAHGVQAFNPACKVPRMMVYFFVPNVLLIFYLFYDFYRKSYTKPKQLKQNEKSRKAS